ncbi:hypothetical protein PQX77_012992 [Marasmius sp. AFHP31]|nr:hypothetical protein PQX77_012992 [Marasmius sp. AFHP31]
MSGPTFFANARGTTIGANATFQAAYGNAVINNPPQCTHAEDRVVLYGKTYRRIIDGDLVYRRRLSSEVISVAIKPESGDGISTLPESEMVQVRKTKQTASIVGVEGMFTVTTFEPAGESDDGFKSVLECVLKAATSLRSPFLTQLFAFGGSNLSAMIAHDELADGQGYLGQFRGKNWIVFNYLVYTHWTAINSLRDDETVVTHRYRYWSVNLKTLSWQFDPTSVALDPPSEKDLQPFFNHLPPLPQDPNRQLNTVEVVACVEETLGDVLGLAASLEGRNIGKLSGWAKHGFLTFGAVVDRNKAEILAHFPSPPPLEWFCKSSHSDVKVSFSGSVPWRVDFLLRKTGDSQVTLNFGWRFPKKNRNQLRTAFLCQSLPFLNNWEDAREVVYVDQVGFTLKSTYHHDPATSSIPTYLFVPPLPIKIINNMRCVPYPPPQPLFFWSHDPQGKETIAAEEWEEFGIPKLEVRHWVGSDWLRSDYNFVYEHLILRDYGWDGREYAREHDYPELIYGNYLFSLLKSVDTDFLSLRGSICCSVSGNTCARR